MSADNGKLALCEYPGCNRAAETCDVRRIERFYCHEHAVQEPDPAPHVKVTEVVGRLDLRDPDCLIIDGGLGNIVFLDTLMPEEAMPHNPPTMTLGEGAACGPRGRLVIRVEFWPEEKP